MSTIWILAVCLLAVTKSILGNTDSTAPQSCPYKCDLLQEITLLRQMVNHESILRMGLETQVQELRKAMSDGLTEVRQNAQQINASMESSSSTQKASLKDEIAKVTVQLENLKKSDRDTDSRLGRTDNTITAIQTGNRNTNQALTRVKRDIQTLQHTTRQLHGNYVPNNMKTIFNITFNFMVCKTRGPSGDYRSPEYNEYFCFKLYFLAYKKI